MRSNHDRPTTAWKPSFAQGLFAIAVVAFVIRVAYVVLTRNMRLWSDAHTYHTLASSIANGDGFVRYKHLQASGQALPTAEKPPLFALWLALLDRMGLRSYLGQRLAMAVVGTGTVVLIGLLARKVAGPTAGWVAAGIAAVYPMLFLADGALMPETLYGLLITLTALIAYRAREVSDLRWWGLLGGVVGLTALTRSEAAMLGVALIVPLALTRTLLPLRMRVLRVAVALLATVVVMTPWTVRNLATFHEFVPTSNSVGAMVAGANCRDAYYGGRAGLWLRSCVVAHPFDDENQARAAQKRTRVGLHYLRTHLSRAPVVAGLRFLRMWGMYHPAQQIRYEALEGRNKTGQTVGTVLAWCLIPLATIGVVGGRARKALPVWPLVTFVAVVSVNSMLTYGNQRFRMGAEPSLVVLAAIGLVVLCKGRVQGIHATAR